ncbi:MAG: 30S ribosomal protein S20 [Fimbriimonadaceae bacterium]|nr:30S ribosomal protein S20 [Fimbriimonadaceae bacterium]
MANLRSSKKDIRRIAKKTERNRATKSAIKTYIKKAKTAEVESAGAAVVSAIKALDKAVQNGVIHKNQAARRKSRLVKAVGPVEAPAKKAAKPAAEKKPAAAKKAPAKKPAAKKAE